jgi:hypothetical protein
MLGGDVGGNVEAVKDAYAAWMSEGVRAFREWP